MTVDPPRADTAMSADRSLLSVSGADRRGFLQGLVTNDISRLDRGLVYAALLSPQGKYLADFLMLERDDAIVLDVRSSLSEELARRLGMYRLRAAVQIAPSGLSVGRGVGPPPDNALPDPRHPALGWRLYSEHADSGRDSGGERIDWDNLRVTYCIPETGIELTPDTYILEAGFERLNGVDFRKGCYVGQEVTARMKHKAELRKGLVIVSVEGEAPVGCSITSDGRTVGTLFTRSGGRALAHLRFDRAKGVLRAADATVRRMD